MHLKNGLSRRSFMVGSVSLLGLAGCARAESSVTQDSSESAARVTVRGDGFESTIPRDPARVVVMEGRGDLEFALLAGYPLVATGNTAAPGSLPAGQYDGRIGRDVQSIGGPDGPSIEEVSALAPDLIVMRANGWRLDWYGNELLSQVAPVLPVEVNEPDFRAQMSSQFDALGRGSDAAVLLDAYDATVADARSELGDALVGRRIALVTSEPAAKGYVNLWTNQIGTTVARDLGLDVLYFDPADEKGNQQLSLENLSSLADADYIFHQTTDPAVVGAAGTWQALPAVAEGRTAVLDPRLNNGLVITASAIADTIAGSIGSWTRAS
ncbi:MAG: ABC transporter substrate-binding protein [Rhodococcus fascians]|uniref:ABC transporter substrate-binding protein n=1 Tax=Nocardiaceae TaxID=85025 RepID=UPI001E60200F|nr:MULTISPECIES: ABC transporter substrate-binding protein [Rhodococcus]